MTTCCTEKTPHVFATQAEARSLDSGVTHFVKVTHVTRIDDWAEQEAEERYPTSLPYNAEFERRAQAREAAKWMAAHMADLLLSDEVVEAAAKTLAELEDSGPLEDWHFDVARGLLQAALNKATGCKKCDAEIPRCCPEHKKHSMPHRGCMLR